jgi:hypothetical protein
MTSAGISICGVGTREAHPLPFERAQLARAQQQERGQPEGDGRDGVTLEGINGAQEFAEGRLLDHDGEVVTLHLGERLSQAREPVELSDADAHGVVADLPEHREHSVSGTPICLDATGTV